MSISSYILGFGVSLLLTGAAFALVGMHVRSGHAWPTHEMALPILVGLALLQFVAQVVFFLHLGREKGTHWNAILFAFALTVVCILVGGTLWIMHTLGHGQPAAREIYPEGIISPQNQKD